MDVASLLKEEANMTVPKKKSQLLSATYSFIAL